MADETMENSVERRQSQRATHRSRIAFSTDGRDRKVAVSRDISSGGICIETDAPLDPGIPLIFFLNLDENLTGITIRGEVLRSWNADGKLYSAVQFRNLSRIHALALEAFIEELLQQPVAQDRRPTGEP